MKKVFQKILTLAMAFAMILTMTATVSATEHCIDDILSKGTAVLHTGDTITGSEEEGVYFTVIDRVGNYWGHPNNENAENSFEAQILSSFDGEKVWRIFGPDSIFQIGDIPGFYSFPVTVDPSVVESVDQNGNPITVRVLLLAEQPEDPIVYTISYDANGGKGTIASHQWEYMEIGKALSDGIGFTRAGYDLVGWTLPGAVDAEGNPIVWSLGESLDLGPGENIVGTKIPAYAGEAFDGKADITFQAVWERNGDPLEEEQPDGDTDANVDADVDTETDADGNTGLKEDADAEVRVDNSTTADDDQKGDEGSGVETAPETGDTTSLFLYVIIMLAAALGCTLRFRQQN